MQFLIFRQYWITHLLNRNLVHSAGIVILVMLVAGLSCKTLFLMVEVRPLNRSIMHEYWQATFDVAMLIGAAACQMATHVTRAHVTRHSSLAPTRMTKT